MWETIFEYFTIEESNRCPLYRHDGLRIIFFSSLWRLTRDIRSTVNRPALPVPPTKRNRPGRFTRFRPADRKKKKNNFFRVFYREVAQDRSKNAPGDDCRKRLGRRQGWAGLVAGIGMESERIAGATGTPDPDCYGRGENHAAVSISERRRIVRLGPG